MGDPRKLRKKYTTPNHPWQKARIEEEKALLKEYGLSNKREIWKMSTIAKNYRDQIKSLVAAHSEQAKKEKSQLFDKLRSYGLLSAEGTMDDVLGLTVKNILDRRMQTLVFKRGLAKSPKQARQFIIHGHIRISDKKITKPSYLVNTAEENQIGFIARSTLSSAEHPERMAKVAKK
jgi:small subunit ribosomal protein S4